MQRPMPQTLGSPEDGRCGEREDLLLGGHRLTPVLSGHQRPLQARPPQATPQLESSPASRGSVGQGPHPASSLFYPLTPAPLGGSAIAKRPPSPPSSSLEAHGGFQDRRQRRPRKQYRQL